MIFKDRFSDINLYSQKQQYTGRMSDNDFSLFFNDIVRREYFENGIDNSFDKEKFIAEFDEDKPYLQDLITQEHMQEFRKNDWKRRSEYIAYMENFIHQAYIDDPNLKIEIWEDYF